MASAAARDTVTPRSGWRWQMPKAWSAKRERQYEHIKEGLEQSGRSGTKAEEIAARTVNK